MKQLKAVLSGLATYVPGYDYMRRTGGTNSARYCYSVWLRHLTLAYRYGSLYSLPSSVAEIGPGDSLGIGLAALLSGVKRYQAVDVVRYASPEKNLSIFDELLALFRMRAQIPGGDEFPSIKPALESYEFPHHILGDNLLETALAETRLAEIKRCIAQPVIENAMIFYAAPWSDLTVLQAGTVDMIFSQAVLEHVDDLPNIYLAMKHWLKPTGLLSHQIDFRSHGKADSWDGHWTYSDFMWKTVVGKRAYLINRQPYSRHLELLDQYDFKVVKTIAQHTKPRVTRRQLAPKYQQLSDADLSTSGAYILATAEVD